MYRLIRELHWMKHSKMLSELQLLILDVDGVLTDGGLWLDQNGEVQKRFDARDGLGLLLLKQIGIKVALVSGGKGGATEKRAQQLGIEHCLVEVKNKIPAVVALQTEFAIAADKTCFLGDDLNDLAVRSNVGLLLSTCDGCRPLRRKADAVLTSKGGYGAVRELAERILKARDEWSELESQGWQDRNG